MNDMEQQFRRHLGLKKAPPGFADRVIAEAARKRTPLQIPKWLAIAAALLVIASICVGVFEHRRASQAIEARDQLLKALDITASALQRTRTKLLKRTKGEI